MNKIHISGKSRDVKKGKGYSVCVRAAEGGSSSLERQLTELQPINKTLQRFSGAVGNPTGAE